MQQRILEVLDKIDSIVWGWPLMVLLIGCGFYLTLALRGLQFRMLWHSLYLAFIKREEAGEGDITHFQALMTALAATVGTGNIAGVATAIAGGGPGALFWMWITGLVGMATKYAEALLAVKYRVVEEDGTMSGGPMYYIEKGLGTKWLGVIFAVFTVCAAFGIGNMVQSNSVADALHSTLNVPTWITGVVLAVLTGLVILGGIKSIARVTSVLVPIMILFYSCGALVILILSYDKIPGAFVAIFEGAFSPTAAAGGFAGAIVRETVKKGLSRGLFSNESGLGSSPIAAAAAQTKHPVSQALVSMTQTFIDTIVVCTFTGLVILVTGAWTQVAADGSPLTGAPLTTAAFSIGLPGEFGGVIVAIGLVTFAYSTLLGWSYYGEKALEYMAGPRVIFVFRIVFSLVVFVGAVAKLKVVWTFADITNGLMAAPNLVALVLLSGVVVRTTKEYFDDPENLK
jgi:alanine or glycine:cation symporter, AGCS family